jgi:hypothetical protein
MYQLVRRQGPVVDRMFEIEFLDRGRGVRFLVRLMRESS